MDEFIRCPQCDDDLLGEDWEQHLGTHGYFKRPVSADAPEGPYIAELEPTKDNPNRWIVIVPPAAAFHYSQWRFEGTEAECKGVRNELNRLDAQQQKQ